MASAVIGALRVNLGIDTAQFQEGLKGVRATLDKMGKNLQQWGGKLSTYVTAPLAAAGVAVTAIVTGMAKDIETLKKSAQISNVGFEEFQKLAFAAQSVGIESEKLADIYKDVNDRIGDFMATGGGPMADFFENIAPKVGITAEAFKNLSGPQALQLYYDSLVKAGASQQDMTFYLEAMASDTTALIPLLANAGQRFRELGEQATVVSDQDAASLQAYTDAMRDMGEAIRAAALAIAGSGILQTITAIVQEVTEWVRYLAQTNPEILKWGTIVAGLAAALGPALVAIGLMATGLAAISAPVALAVAGIAALTAGVIAFWPEIQRAGQIVGEFVSGTWAAFIAAWRTAFDTIGMVATAVGQFSAKLTGAFVALPGKMMEIGAQIIQGLWDGLKSKMAEVRDGIAGFAGSIVDSVKAKLGIHSPSRVMHEVGVNIMQGLSDGMGSMQQNITGGAVTMADSIAGAFSGLGSSLSEAIKGTKEWKDVALDALRSIGQSLLSNMSFGGGLFGSVFKGLLGGLMGFANGGSFQVGGAGGVDSQLVAFKASPNERVDITKPGQSRGGTAYAPTYNIDARGADTAAIARLEGALREMDRNFNKRVDHRVDVRQTRGTRA